MLKLEKILFRHQGASVEYDFSLNANRKDIIGIIGESGSGKSTLLELVAGFLQPTAGKMTWDGNDLCALPPGKRPVTILFQNHNLFEHLTARQNIALGLNSEGRTNATEEQIIDETLAKVGLSDHGNQLASTLSGGQQQRVALARAFVRRQPIVLLDEPFTGLDDDNKKAILKLVAELAKTEQKCVLMVTHDPSDCEMIATHVYKTEQGELSKQR